MKIVTILLFVQGRLALLKRMKVQKLPSFTKPGPQMLAYHNIVYENLADCYTQFKIEIASFITLSKIFASSPVTKLSISLQHNDDAKHILISQWNWQIL